MGFNRDTGIFVSLTNVARRKDAPPGARSRGHLVMDLLTQSPGFRLDELEAACAAFPAVAPTSAGLPSTAATRHVSATAAGAAASTPPSSSSSSSSSAATTAAPLHAAHATAPTIDLSAPYAGFNIVVAQLGGSATAATPRAFFLTNRPVLSEAAGACTPVVGAALPDDAVRVGSLLLRVLPPTTAVVMRLQPGVHVLSNSTLNDQTWLKVAWVRQQLQGVALRMAVDGAATDMEDGCSDGAHAGTPTAAAASAAAATDVSARPLRSAPLVPAEPVLSDITPASKPADVHEAAVLPADEAGALRDVLTQLGAISNFSDAVPVGGDATIESLDFSWSDMAAEAECHLQRHVFIKPLWEHKYGTRATTIVAQVKGVVYYCFASHDPTVTGAAVASGPLAPPAAAGSAVMGAHGAPALTMAVDGVEWRVFRTAFPATPV